MKKKYIALVIISLLTSIYFMYEKTEPNVDFFDVTFLRNSPAVEKILQQDGFFDVHFTTQDNIRLNATMIDRSDTLPVQATMLSCPGFVPGKKEGMATLYIMLKDNPYNFMFLDTRGHGKSEGELLTYAGIKNYGESEFKDIVAAIEFLVNYNQEHKISPDIIVHGLCSGAFHTIKAIGYLQKNNPAAYHCIKGVVFDSGWPAVADIAETTLSSEAIKRCKTYNISYLESYAAYFITKFYQTFFKDHHRKQKSIRDAIAEISTPILFIHAENDTYIPIHHIYPLIHASQKPTSWIIKESTHAVHHLKHKDTYKDQLENFILASIDKG